MSIRKVFREGQKFGKLLAIEYVQSKKYRCICECGNEKVVSTSNLIHGTTTSCGCARSIHRIDYDKFALEKLISSVKINEKGCWIWAKSLHRQGYGHFPYKRKVHLAHRVSWILHYGPIPDEILVLHKCDNPSCCNPGHLFLGSDKTNAEDRENKKRGNQNKGSNHWFAKINEEDVLKIRKMRSEGKTHLDVSKHFGISKCQIGFILRGKSWSHVN